MKKVLIYFHEKYMTPSGGPSGYLYNLRAYLERAAQEDVKKAAQEDVQEDAKAGVQETSQETVKLVFLNDTDFRSNFAFKMKNAAHRVFESDRSLSDVGKRVQQIFFESEQEGPFDLSGFDAVHFHSTADMFTQKKNLENYKGKVILTSHTPEAPHLEWIDDLMRAGGRNDGTEVSEKEQALLSRTKEFDDYAFRRADYLIFPCREAEEPYFHTWEEYPKIRKEEKIFYLPTGTEKRIPKKTRQQIREKLHIPEDRFVISFVGRHNGIKGYDRLKNIFNGLHEPQEPQELQDRKDAQDRKAVQDRKAAQDRKDAQDLRSQTDLPGVTVLCCGKEGVIPAPDSQDWIEAGWTDDAASYVQASDLFILPNRETYFDLALLETLSVGKLSLLSRTGGNKVFEGMEDRGIYLFDTEEEAVSKIRKIMNEDTVVRKEKEAAQRVLFEREYTMETFYDRYMEILKKICGERR